MFHFSPSSPSCLVWLLNPRKEEVHWLWSKALSVLLGSKAPHSPRLTVKGAWERTWDGGIGSSQEHMEPRIATWPTVLAAWCLVISVIGSSRSPRIHCQPSACQGRLRLHHWLFPKEFITATSTLKMAMVLYCYPLIKVQLFLSNFISRNNE